MASETTETKQIGNYQVQLLTKFDSKEDDKIFLELEVSKDLQDLLGSIAVKEEVEFTHQLNNYSYNSDSNNEQKDLKRYKAKRWVYSALSSNPSRDYLFLVDLVEKGKAKLPFVDASKMEEVITDFKHQVRKFVEVVDKYKAMKMTVTYQLGVTDE